MSNPNPCQTANQDPMKEYTEFVDLCFKNKSEVVFPNFDVRHGVVILRAIFENAKKKVRVFCNSLHHDAWGDKILQTKIEDALEREVEIYIITQNECDKEVSCFFRGKADKGMVIYESKFKEKEYNFVVADDDKYRAELKPQTDARKAIACAKGKGFAKDLIDKFDRMVVEIHANENFSKKVSDKVQARSLLARKLA